MRIFISYRRADTQLTAGRMAQFLDALPVVEQVFLDVDGIAPGEDFEQRIHSSLAQASHCFVLIGPAWPGPPSAEAASRLFDPQDMVRREAALALAAAPALKLVPILVDDATMPTAAQLPPALQPLSKLNAFHLRNACFDEDMDALLDKLMGARPERGSRWAQAPLSRVAVLTHAGAGALAGAGFLLLLALLIKLIVAPEGGLTGWLQASLRIEDYEEAFHWLCVLMIGVLLLSALAPFALRRLSARRAQRRAR